MSGQSDALLTAMLARYYTMDPRKAEHFEVSDEEWDAAAVRMEQYHGTPQMRAAYVRVLAKVGPDLPPKLRPHFMGLPLKLREESP